MNVIKPMRLWRFSGIKHIRKWTLDRITARSNHDHDQRSRLEVLKLLSIVYGSAFGFAYSYGIFSPKKQVATIIKPKPNNDSNKKSGVDNLPHCPSDKKKKFDKPCK